MPSSLLLVLTLKMAAGLLADRVFGEARRFHPLVGFGRWAGWVERACRRLFFGTNETGMRLAGLLAWALAVLPWVALALWLRTLHAHAHWVVDSALLAMKGSIWMTRPAMVHYATPRAHMLAMADELFGLVRAGKIVGEPKQRFALADAAQAHRALESRGTVGAMCEHEETLTRLEAMLVSLRDQMDRLSERVDARLADQQLAISRLRIDLAKRPVGYGPPHALPRDDA